MEYFLEMHLKFLNRIYAASLILPNCFTVLPTIVFLVFTFIFLYQQNRRQINNTYNRGWKMKVFLNIRMHWIYFNVCRIWFILMSTSRKLLNVVHEFIEKSIDEDDQLYNQVVLNTLAILIISLFSLFPMILLVVDTSNRANFPNLLMWVIEDPWLHHEIGRSGRCLQSPNNLNVLLELKNPPYRIKRSMSYDINQLKSNTNNRNLSRNTKSMSELMDY